MMMLGLLFSGLWRVSIVDERCDLLIDFLSKLER